jgi:hypothetical protein
MISRGSPPVRCPLAAAEGICGAQVTGGLWSADTNPKKWPRKTLVRSVEREQKIDLSRTTFRFSDVISEGRRMWYELTRRKKHRTRVSSSRSR